MCNIYPSYQNSGCSVFGNAVFCVDASASYYTQEITYMGGCLMWNYAAVCGGRMWLNFFVRVWSDMWKSLERESEMMFSVPLMCCDNRDVLLLNRVKLIQWDRSSCDSTYTGSKDALCIQPSALKLSVNSKICSPFVGCKIVMYIDIADARNYNRFSVSFPCYTD